MYMYENERCLKTHPSHDLLFLEPCGDWSNPAQWFKLNARSKLHNMEQRWPYPDGPLIRCANAENSTSGNRVYMGDCDPRSKRERMFYYTAQTDTPYKPHPKRARLKRCGPDPWNDLSFYAQWNDLYKIDHVNVDFGELKLISVVGPCASKWWQIYPVENQTPDTQWVTPDNNLCT